MLQRYSMSSIVIRSD